MKVRSQVVVSDWFEVLTLSNIKETVSRIGPFI